MVHPSHRACPRRERLAQRPGPAYTAALDSHVPGGFEYLDIRLDGGPWRDGSVFREVDDVHATQGGLLSRACAAALHPECGRVAAIDEATVLSVAANADTPHQGQRRGDGFVWRLEASDGTLNTRRLT